VWGIGGYEPQPVTAVDELVARHSDRLQSLVGRRLSHAWALCYVCDGGWCSTLPLALDFGGCRLEIAADGFDRLYLTWNEIDLDNLPDTEDQDDPDLEVAWSEPDLPELRRMIGAAVREVRILQNDLRFEAVDGGRVEAWLLGGLEFLFEPGEAALQVYNGLNALALGQEDRRSDSWRRCDLLGSSADRRTRKRRRHEDAVAETVDRRTGLRLAGGDPSCPRLGRLVTGVSGCASGARGRTAVPFRSTCCPGFGPRRKARALPTGPIPRPEMSGRSSVTR
jgi:hypothetical protein